MCSTYKDSVDEKFEWECEAFSSMSLVHSFDGVRGLAAFQLKYCSLASLILLKRAVLGLSCLDNINRKSSA